MTFKVTVRWHPPGEGSRCTSAWFVKSLRGGSTFLVLEDVSGIEVCIPLDRIEYLQMERVCIPLDRIEYLQMERKG